MKKFSVLLRGITLNQVGDFYSLNCFHSYRTENKLRNYVEMPDEDTKMLKYKHGEKYLKAPVIIYADLECLLEKMYLCENNPENSSIEKITMHTPSGYSLFTDCSFD